jgi:hypothetical protein
MKNSLEIDEHAWRLSNFFTSLYFHESEDQEWLHMSEWLHMASSIVNVDIDSTRFDRSDMDIFEIYCSAVSRSNVWAKHCMELSRFNFIWGCLEYVIKRITPTETGGSKVNLGCNYLTKFYDKKPIKEYEYYLEALKTTLQDSYTQLVDLNAELKKIKDQKWSYVCEGLFIISKVRNLFAHGALPLPTFEDEIEDAETYKIVTISSKIILLTIQMLLLAYFKEDDFIDSSFVPIESKRGKKIKIISYLKFLHLPNFEELV